MSVFFKSDCHNRFSIYNSLLGLLFLEGLFGNHLNVAEMRPDGTLSLVIMPPSIRSELTQFFRLSTIVGKLQIKNISSKFIEG